MNYLKFYSFIVTTLLLSACGGGGSDSKGGDQPSPVFSFSIDNPPSSIAENSERIVNLSLNNPTADLSITVQQMSGPSDAVNLSVDTAASTLLVRLGELENSVDIRIRVQALAGSNTVNREFTFRGEDVSGNALANSLLQIEGKKEVYTTLLFEQLLIETLSYPVGWIDVKQDLTVKPASKNLLIDSFGSIALQVEKYTSNKITESNLIEFKNDLIRTLEASSKPLWDVIHFQANAIGLHIPSRAGEQYQLVKEKGFISPFVGNLNFGQWNGNEWEPNSESRAATEFFQYTL